MLGRVHLRPVDRYSVTVLDTPTELAISTQKWSMERDSANRKELPAVIDVRGAGYHLTEWELKEFQRYIVPLEMLAKSDHPLLSNREISTVFASWREIKEISKTLVKKLEEFSREWPRWNNIGKALIEVVGQVLSVISHTSRCLSWKFIVMCGYILFSNWYQSHLLSILSQGTKFWRSTEMSNDGLTSWRYCCRLNQLIVQGSEARSAGRLFGFGFLSNYACESFSWMQVLSYFIRFKGYPVTNCCSRWDIPVKAVHVLPGVTQVDPRGSCGLQKPFWGSWSDSAPQSRSQWCQIAFRNSSTQNWRRTENQQPTQGRNLSTFYDSSITEVLTSLSENTPSNTDNGKKGQVRTLCFTPSAGVIGSRPFPRVVVFHPE